jgi:hypothetical protein
VHDELPDIGIARPDDWNELDDESRARSFLDTDRCEIVDDDGSFFYVRGVLELPIVGLERTFGFGAWGALREQDFERYVELEDDPRRFEQRPYASVLANRLPGYPDTYGLRASLVANEPGTRPSILLEAADHPLVHDQRHGITLERAVELVTPFLHAA